MRSTNNHSPLNQKSTIENSTLPKNLIKKYFMKQINGFKHKNDIVWHQKIKEKISWRERALNKITNNACNSVTLLG